jgi:hypothetical protein
MHFVIIIQFFPIFCWLRRLANVHWQVIVVHRAGVRPLARQNILPLTGSDDSEQFHCVVRNCHQPVHNDGTCCKESNPCSVIYNISPRIGLSPQTSECYVVCAAWTVVMKQPASTVIVHKNTLLLFLECLLSPHHVFIMSPEAPQTLKMFVS